MLNVFQPKKYNMKSKIVLLFALISAFETTAFAQKPPSFRRDSVKETFNDKSIMIRYGKPTMNGRKIFGGAVPYYKVWRTGAGQSTELETEVDIEMEGAIIPQGKYSLYTIPTETTWKFIINKQTGQWGTVYNSQLDLARIDVQPKRLSKPVEELTFRIQKRSASEGALVLEWETTYIEAPFHVSQEPLLPSPRDSVIRYIDGARLVVDYSRPSVRGRKIFGGVVPYGQVWRTGANAATSLTTTSDLLINKVRIPKGSYTLYTLPTKRGWWLIINKQTGQWGTVYNRSLDLARLPMKVTLLPYNVEKFTISIEPLQGKRGVLKLQWERTEASVEFEVIESK